MRRTNSVVAALVAVVVLLGAAACGGSSSSAPTTTAPNSGSAVSGGTAAVDAYCAKVAELAKVVEEKGTGAREDVQRLADEIKTLSTEASKSLPGNAAASKEFGECSLDASKRIAEAYKPG